MIELTEHTNPYMDVHHSSTSVASFENIARSASLTSSNEDTFDCYLRPYNSLIATADIHPYDQSQHINTTNIATYMCSEEVTRHDGGSINMRQFLLKGAEKTSNVMYEVQTNKRCLSTEAPIDDLINATKEASNMNENVYQIIDESKIIDLTASSNSVGSYLYPYNSMITTTDINTYLEVVNS